MEACLRVVRRVTEVVTLRVLFVVYDGACPWPRLTAPSVVSSRNPRSLASINPAHGVL